MNRIYLDHAATSPLRPEARAAMLRAFAIWANPSSPHAEGRGARAALEGARARVRAALGWEGEVIFTSGASEALALGIGRARAGRRIISAVEHDAVVRAAKGAQVLKISGDGVADRDDLARLLANAECGPPLVAIQQVNSETGAIQPVGELAAMVRAAGGWLIADCAQGAGRLPLPDCDMAVVSAHKLGGPVGIGALLVRDFSMIEPSGGHERGYRPGTENLPAALGFAAALEAGGVASWATSAAERLAFRQDLLRGHLLALNGEFCDHIVAIAHTSMRAQALLIRLDGLGFAVSAGSACSSGTLKKSRVLDGFGVADELAARTIRVSLGWNTSAADLEAFVQALAKLG